MESLKRLILKHFEFCIVAVIIVSILILHLLVESSLKGSFLNFYYLPVLLAGYCLGRRHAISTAVLAVVAVAVLVVLVPQSFTRPVTLFSLALNVISWSLFLVLTAMILGLLFEAKQKRVEDLQQAYVGIVEILAKYLESADRYTKGHSLRVAHLATDIAVAMGRSGREVDNIRTAALLHDIGKVEVSSDLIRKAAELTTEEKELVATHADKGAEILKAVGSVLKDAVPLVLHHHRFYVEQETTSPHGPAALPVGARIIAVADAFDAIVTDRPYRKGRPPWQAVREIETATPTQFDPDVVRALRHVMSTVSEEEVVV